VLVLLEDFSEADLLFGELSLEAECEVECSTFIGAATTTAAGATITGAG
jgi:hypothetical protein